MTKSFQVLILTIFVLFSIFQVKGQSKPLLFGEQLGYYRASMAKYPGGLDSLRTFYGKHLKWLSPKFCGQGTVILSLVVEKDGTLSNIEVMRSLCKECDKEALRVVGLMPKWIPSMENGKAIARKMYLPIRFRLE